MKKLLGLLALTEVTAGYASTNQEKELHPTDVVNENAQGS